MCLSLVRVPNSYLMHWYITGIDNDTSTTAIHPPGEGLPWDVNIKMGNCLGTDCNKRNELLVYMTMSWCTIPTHINTTSEIGNNNPSAEDVVDGVVVCANQSVNSRESDDKFSFESDTVNIL